MTEQVLGRDRRHARANWIAGNIAQDEGALDRALSRYRRAVRAAPRFTEAHNDLGTVYHAKHWHAEAEECFREALRLAPEHEAALENLASALRAQGKIKEARNYYLRSLKVRLKNRFSRWLRPSSASTRTARTDQDLRPVEEVLAAARKELDQRKHSEARCFIEEALLQNPEDARLHHLLGVTALREGDVANAINSLEKAVGLRSSVPEYRVDLGNAYVATKQYARAADCFRVALLLDPEYAAAAANVAKLLYDLGHYKHAETVYRDSLRMDPEFAVVRLNLASTLVALGQVDEAYALASEVLQANPASTLARIILARMHVDLGNPDSAFDLLQQAEQLEPGSAEVHRALAEYWINGPGDIAAAERHLQRSLELDPDNPKVELLISYVHFQFQRFTSGWKAYESRKRLPERASNYRLLPYPHWDGSPPKGRRIAVVAEQGLGDEIMFASCLPDLLRSGARVGLLCSRRLEALMRRSFPSVEIFPGSHLSAEDRYPVPEGYDLQVAAGSLPGFYRHEPGDFPATRGYLRASNERVAFWKKRTKSLGDGIKVGISWRGGSPLTGKVRRTLTPSDLAPLFAIKGVRWVSLQYGNVGDEVETMNAQLGAGLSHWQDAVDDLDETAALISALDLCISVGNTQIHIAGALGRDVWVLTPKMPDWRYGMAGERMLWYPTATLFRQQTSRDWSAPIALVADRLKRKVREG